MRATARRYSGGMKRLLTREIIDLMYPNHAVYNMVINDISCENWIPEAEVSYRHAGGCILSWQASQDL